MNLKRFLQIKADEILPLTDLLCREFNRITEGIVENDPLSALIPGPSIDATLWARLQGAARW